MIVLFKHVFVTTHVVPSVFYSSTVKMMDECLASSEGPHVYSFPRFFFEQQPAQQL